MGNTTNSDHRETHESEYNTSDVEDIGVKYISCLAFFSLANILFHECKRTRGDDIDMAPPKRPKHNEEIYRKLIPIPTPSKKLERKHFQRAYFEVGNTKNKLL